MVLVAHCVLNQNTKLDGCAHYPGAMAEAVAELVGSGVGIVQLPCPELRCLGLDRQRAPGSRPSVAEEDTRIARRMGEPAARDACRALAGEVAREVEEYLRHGFEVVGLVGIDGSPSCAAHVTWREGVEAPGPGLFVEALERAVAGGLPKVGVRASDPATARKAIRSLLRP